MQPQKKDQNQSMANYQNLWTLISLYLLAISAIFHHLERLKSFLLFKPNLGSIIFTIPDTLVTLYYKLCNLSPCKVNIDDQTTLHFWKTNNVRLDKPTLLLIHGYGGNSLWQFVRQVKPLSKNFNVYIPDLLFFGKSYTNSPNRSEGFQAKCVAEGMTRLGVERYAVYGISYGGFVAYCMADMWPERVEKVVIVSSGVVWNDQQKEELLSEDSNALEILLTKNPKDLRLLMKRSIYKYDFLKWVPDFVLQKLIDANQENNKEKLELLQHLVAKKADASLPILSQETLIIWGNQDKVFPLYMAYDLQRHLGAKSKLEIIKDTGHAANFDSPDTINGLIKTFVLGS